MSYVFMYYDAANSFSYNFDGSGNGQDIIKHRQPGTAVADGDGSGL